MLRFVCVLATFMGGGQPAGAALMPGRQDQAQSRDAERDDVVVTARRGAADIPPEAELDPDEIDALDAYDIGEVIRRIGETRALGEAPVIIVNGKRMADPGILLGFPPDALTRVEVLPREAGALYGGDPSRRVLNIVLQRRFASRDGQLDAETPTAGGMSSLAADIRQGMIAGNSTTQFGVRASRDSALLETERSQYVEDHPGRAAVSLRPSAEMVGANLALNRPVGEWSASMNLQAQARRMRSLSLSGGALVETGQASRSLSMIAGLSGQLAGWSLQTSLTALLSAASQSGLSDTESRQRSLAATLAASRTMFNLPAGPVSVSLTAQASRSHMTSMLLRTWRAYSAQDIGLSGTVSVPLWQPPSSGEGTALMRLLGGMSASLGANLRRSDGGRGSGLNAGLTWTLPPRLRLNGAWSTSTESVPDAQRFAPEYFGTAITVFDFATGEAATVLPILGGTPGLRPPRFDRLSLSAFLGPFAPWNLAMSVSLQQSSVLNSIGPLPAVTPELEAIFPDRFRRNGEGRLAVIDQRPVNFDSARTRILTSSLGATFPLGGAMTGKRRDALRLTLNHNWQLRNTMRVHAALPEMDRLSGDGGGLPRQQVDMQIDVRQGPWSVNTTARWRSGYRVRRESGRNGPDDLRVAPLGTIDLRLIYAPRRVVPTGNGGGSRRGAGAQLVLEVANLFDRRPRASLGDGRKAPGYGHDDQDPVGRTIRLTMRNRF